VAERFRIRVPAMRLDKGLMLKFRAIHNDVAEEISAHRIELAPFRDSTMHGSSRPTEAGLNDLR